MRDASPSRRLPKLWRAAAAVLALLALVPAASADESFPRWRPLFSYTALIDQSDLRDARGRLIRDPAQVLARDRENYHRGQRQFADEWDPIFMEPRWRAEMLRLFRLAPVDSEVRRILRDGHGIVHVSVWGDARQGLQEIRVERRRRLPIEPMMRLPTPQSR